MDGPEPTTITAEPSPSDLDPRRKPAPRSRRAVQRLLLSAPVAWILATGWHYRWMTDDGFIYMRIMAQLRSGNGPVFNAGERVEAHTGTVWVFLVAAADLLTPIRLEWLLVLLGLAGTAGGVALAIDGARRLIAPPDRSALAVPVGAVVFCAVTASGVWATSGLETGLTFAWLGACLSLCARWAEGDDLSMPWWHAVILGLGWLIRPDMVLFSAAFLVVVTVTLARRSRRGDAVRIAATMIAVPAAYQIFRMGYYGSIVPNTAVAKNGTADNVSRGLAYLRDFVDPYWLWVPALVLAAGGYVPLALSLTASRQRRALAIVASFLVCGALQIAYVVRVGGDYLHGRLLMPGFFAICAPVAVVPAVRRTAASVLVVPWALAAVLVMRPRQWSDPDGLLGGIALFRPTGQVTTDDIVLRGEWIDGPGLYHQVAPSRIERADGVTLDPSGPDTVVYAAAIGLIGYRAGTDVPVLDFHGLADPLAARLELGGDVIPRFRLAGHEALSTPAWAAARLTSPGTDVEPASFVVLGDPVVEGTFSDTFDEDVAWARAALECGDLRDLVDSYREPLTVGRFLDNLAGSFSSPRLTVPSDPEEAYRTFCGDGVPAEVQAIRER